MAVYTKINQKEINIINENFNINKVISFKGIKQGIENTNYVLKSKKEIPFFGMNSVLFATHSKTKEETLIICNRFQY